MQFLTLDGKDYDLAPITFSPESIELLEIIDELTDSKDQAKAAKGVLKAIRLMYGILVDCLVRGGNDKAEVIKALAGVTISLETIQDFLKTMVQMD